MVDSPWSMVNGPWSMVDGRWSMVNGQWSMVDGRWSMVFHYYLCAMPRILAIDYGTKRTGLAVTDPEHIIATGLATVKTAEVIAYLKQYLKQESVSCFVVGEPRMMNNKPSPVTPAIEKFVGTLKKNFPLIPVEREDERFTSLMAQRSMLESGLKKSDRQNKEFVDLASAVLILQSWMERKARSAENRGGQ